LFLKIGGHFCRQGQRGLSRLSIHPLDAVWGSSHLRRLWKFPANAGFDIHRCRYEWDCVGTDLVVLVWFVAEKRTIALKTFHIYNTGSMGRRSFNPKSSSSLVESLSSAPSERGRPTI